MSRLCYIIVEHGIANNILNVRDARGFIEFQGMLPYAAITWTCFWLHLYHILPRNHLSEVTVLSLYNIWMGDLRPLLEST